MQTHWGQVADTSSAVECDAEPTSWLHAPQRSPLPPSFCSRFIATVVRHAGNGRSTTREAGYQPEDTAVAAVFKTQKASDLVVGCSRVTDDVQEWLWLVRECRLCRAGADRVLWSGAWRELGEKASARELLTPHPTSQDVRYRIAEPESWLVTCSVLKLPGTWLTPCPYLQSPAALPLQRMLGATRHSRLTSQVPWVSQT